MAARARRFGGGWSGAGRSDAGIGPGAHGRITLGCALLATRRHRAPEVWAERVERDGHAIVQTVKTGEGARTMGLDPTTHRIYLPAAEYETGANGRRTAKPGSFMILVVAPQARK